MSVEDELISAAKRAGKTLDNPPPSLAPNLLLVCTLALCAVLYTAWGMFRDDLSRSFAEIRDEQTVLKQYIRCSELRFLSGGKEPCGY